MKTILPWLVAVLALAAAGVFYQSTKSKSVELATLQAEVKELETLRTELAELKSQQVPAEELARLRKDNLDLLRLRNEIRQTRDEKNQFAKQTQAALGEVQRAQAQVQSLSTNLQAAQVLSAARQQAAFAQEKQYQQQLIVCINHLRQMDAAKQQWALEHKKTDQATPTTPDITPYLKDSLWPACPGGGKYTLGAVNVAPTCSLASHALPQQ